MRCGLFGKLPMKRDFIAIGVPRPFLAVWEPWLDAGLADSRAALGAAWKDAFFAAPIWRFCLGPAICGIRVAGAVMPSIDAIGRAFPLTLVATDETEAPFARLPGEAWFAAVEEYLLDTLAPEASFAATLDRLAGLETVSPEDDAASDPLYRAAGDPESLTQNKPWMSNTPHPEVRAKRASKDGPLRACCPSFETRPSTTPQDEGRGKSSGYFRPGSELCQPLAALFVAPADGADATSVWWTRGGAAYPALAWGQAMMPPPPRFTSMLTGRFPAPAPTH